MIDSAFITFVLNKVQFTASSLQCDHMILCVCIDFFMMLVCECDRFDKVRLIDALILNLQTFRATSVSSTY